MQSDRKRLCIMIPGHWSNIMGGSQYQAKCLIEELSRLNSYEIYYLARDCEENQKPESYKMVHYGYVGSKKRGAHRHLIESVLLPKFLHEIKPNVIYQRVGCAQTGIAARYAIKNSCKMIWHIASEYDLELKKVAFRRFFLERILDRLFLRYGILNATHIIAQTDDQRRMLKMNYNIDASAVIPNFHPFPEEQITKEDPVKVVWVSNLKAVKRPEIFMKLAEDLRSLPNTEFIMIGAIQGKNRELTNFFNRMATVPNFRYIGPKSQEEVNSILAESHLLVNTSIKEGFPNTFIQAWMRRVPVVSLGVDPDRLIQNHSLGIACRNYEMLKDSVAYLIINHRERTNLGANAEKFALQRFSLKNVVDIVNVMES